MLVLHFLCFAWRLRNSQPRLHFVKIGALDNIGNPAQVFRLVFTATGSSSMFRNVV